MRPSSSLWSVFDVAAEAQEAARLEEESAQPGFWDDSDAAQRTMRRLARLKESSARWLNAQQRINDAIELAELDDDSIEDELRAETDALEAEVERLSFLAKLSGKYDAEDAYLAIHAGAGGTDAQDWAQMLLRMYLRWAERRGFKVEVVDQMPGDEAGVKSVTLAIRAITRMATSNLRRCTVCAAEPVRLEQRRHTSFCLVEVWPTCRKTSTSRSTKRTCRSTPAVAAQAGRTSRRTR